MKQFIVLLAGIVLGVALSGIIIGFEDNAKTAGTATNTQMTKITEQIKAD